MLKASALVLILFIVQALTTITAGVCLSAASQTTRHYKPRKVGRYLLPVNSLVCSIKYSQVRT